jgi:DNA-binding XRE family transcriptional regulator
MPDSAFWRRFATRFRKLQPKRDKGLSAEWFEVDRRWDLQGASTASVLRRFKQAAQVAARKKSGSREADFNTWLDLLKQEADAFRMKGTTSTRPPVAELEPSASPEDPGPDAARWTTPTGEQFVWSGSWGEIPRVCEVSADYCEALADQDENSKPQADVRRRIGRNIRKLRELCFFTQDELAKEVGIDRELVNRHENGRSLPNAKIQKCYTDVFSRELKRPITASDLRDVTATTPAAPKVIRDDRRGTLHGKEKSLPDGLPDQTRPRRNSARQKT